MFTHNNNRKVAQWNGKTCKQPLKRTILIIQRTFLHYKEPFAQWKGYMDDNCSLWNHRCWGRSIETSPLQPSSWRQVQDIDACIEQPQDQDPTSTQSTSTPEVWDLQVIDASWYHHREAQNHFPEHFYSPFLAGGMIFPPPTRMLNPWQFSSNT